MSALVKRVQDRWRRAFTGRNRGQSLFVGSTLTPLMLYMLFWTLLPTIWAVVLVFFKYSATRSGGPILGLGGDNPFVGLGHFRNMLGDSLEAQKFRMSVKNTLIFAFLVLPLNLSITIPLAVAIEAVHQRLKTVFRFIYFLPTLTASVGVAIMWGYLYHPQQGLFNMVLKALGASPKIWLTDPREFLLGVPLAMWAIIFAYGLQPGHLHRCAAGHPARVQRGGRGGWRQRLADILAHHAAIAAADTAVRLRHDHALLVSGVRHHSDYDRR